MTENSCGVVCPCWILENAYGALRQALLASANRAILAGAVRLREPAATRMLQRCLVSGKISRSPLLHKVPTMRALLFLLVLVAIGRPSLSAAESENLTFERDIRPLLKIHCLDCHGATEEKKGGLDLRLRRLIVKGGESGPAIVAGSPAESRLLDRIRRGEMPPSDTKVPARAIEVFSRWIAAGAPTARPEPDQLGTGIGVTLEERSYWAFQPITRPPIPAAQDATRTRNPIDAFVQARQRAQGLQFAPDADRVTLIRRIYLDLIGLPADPSTSQRLRRRPTAPRLRTVARPTPQLAPLRRTLGTPLVGCQRLRRLRGIQ